MKTSALNKTYTVIVLIILVIAGLGYWIIHGQVAPGRIRNVLLISIDTCRPDFLSCYGYPLKTTPNIDRLAEEGILFEKVISPLPFTLPAHCSMLTGMIPPSHKVHDNTFFHLDEEKTTLAEILKDNGFATAGFISSFVINSSFGMDQGFDKYDDKFSDDRNTMGLVERRADETTDRALKWLEKNKDNNNFMFLHYFDPHFTYDAPEPFGSSFPNAPMPQNIPTRLEAKHLGFYAGEIAYVDHNIGKVVEKLKQLGIYESTLICVTSDHGESLGEHDESTHGYYIYDSTVRVPLIMKVPGEKKGIRVKSVAGLVDIVPTICSLLGIEYSDQIEGKDLGGYIKEPDSALYPDRYVYTQSLEPTKYNANPLLGIVGDHYKYILTRNSELYNIEEDPWERSNLTKKELKRSHQMEGRLREIIDKAATGEKTSGLKEMDAETLQKLESLGYVGDVVNETFVIDPAKQDPKDLIDYHVIGSRVGYYIQSKEYNIAEINCKQMINKEPELYMGYYKMAKLSMYQEKYSDAIKYFAKVIQLEKDFVYAYAGLVDAYKRSGQYDKAIAYCFKTLELKPDFVEIYNQLSICYYEQGMFEEGEKYLTEAIKNNRLYPDVLTHLGNKLVEKGQILRAFDKYTERLKLEPESVDALNAVAWLQGASNIKELRNPREALRLAKKACEISEQESPEAMDTLAVAYAANGYFDKAILAAKKAITQADSEGNEAMSERIRKRIELYKNGHIYIDAGLKQK